jgi:hypothetical protein
VHSLGIADHVRVDRLILFDLMPEFDLRSDNVPDLLGSTDWSDVILPALTPRLWTATSDS